MNSFLDNTLFRHTIDENILYATLRMVDEEEDYRLLFVNGSSHTCETLRDFVSHHYKLVKRRVPRGTDPWNTCEFYKSGKWWSCSEMLPPAPKTTRVIVPAPKTTKVAVPSTPSRPIRSSAPPSIKEARRNAVHEIRVRTLSYESNSQPDFLAPPSSLDSTSPLNQAMIQDESEENVHMVINEDVEALNITAMDIDEEEIHEALRSADTQICPQAFEIPQYDDEDEDDKQSTVSTVTMKCEEDADMANLREWDYNYIPQHNTSGVTRETPYHPRPIAEITLTRKNGTYDTILLHPITYDTVLHHPVHDETYEVVYDSYTTHHSIVHRAFMNKKDVLDYFRNVLDGLMYDVNIHTLFASIIGYPSITLQGYITSTHTILRCIEHSMEIDWCVV